jgi:hypothetical protein
MSKKTIFIGIIAGVATSAFAIVLEKQLMTGTNIWLSFIPTVFSISLMIFLAISKKKENNGFMSFKEGFVELFIFGIISSMINSVISYLNLFVLKSKEQIQELVNLMKDGMLQKGLTEQMAIEAAEKTFNSPIFMLYGFGGAIVISAILGAIIAAIFKKNDDSL